MWRGIYWSKLPGASRKTRVAISWVSDLVLPPHPVQLNLGAGRGATQAHYEPGEIVFEEGDAGDSLFMILAGQVEVVKCVGAEPRVVGTLGPGEYFGEMALLGRRPRSATTRAQTQLDLLVLPGSDFSALAESLTEFRSEFEEIAHTGGGGRSASRVGAKLAPERAHELASSPPEIAEQPAHLLQARSQIRVADLHRQHRVLQGREDVICHPGRLDRAVDQRSRVP
jgi:CRP-like cAMP-binding protein